MAKLLGPIAVALADVYLLGQLARDSPLLPPLMAGGLLLILNLAAGLRLGDAGRSAYAEGVATLNLRLARQNEELAECNRMLLAKLSDDTFPADDEEDLLDPHSTSARM